MPLRVLGAGLGRTGTQSLKVALEHLLEGPCYHMVEVHGHDERVQPVAPSRGRRAAGLGRGVRRVRGHRRLAGGRLLARAPRLLPDALVILSVRDDAAAWWESADRTIFEVIRRGAPASPWLDMWSDLASKRFCEDWSDEAAAVAAYEQHNDDVIAAIPSEQLLVWRPGDGWDPICAALAIPVPDDPFPHVNTAEEFRLRSRLNRRRPSS